jgi:PAS domain S-box-containing protein
MKKDALRFGLNSLKFIFAILVVAFAAQFTVTLTDDRFGEHIRQVAPVFGVAISLVLLGGYRYLLPIFFGALLPSFHFDQSYFLILSLPVAVSSAAAWSRWVLLALQVDPKIERIRDALLLIFVGLIASCALGAVLQTLLFCWGTSAAQWSQFFSLVFIQWLSAVVGAVIVTPFILTWASPTKYRLHGGQGLELILWFLTLLAFGHVTFQNWAPTEVLLYPMELALFPVMAWAAIRFGLRGASAGVLALALLAGYEIIMVLAGHSGHMTQSPANVWVFVGIISITSICLAAVMTELRMRESEVLENESRLRAFTEALPDVAFVLSSEGEICDVFAASKRIEANHRITLSSSVIGKNLSDIFEPEVCHGFLYTIKESIRFNQIRKHEYTLVSADFGEHNFEARVTPMHSSSGPLRRVVWVAYDISDRKRAESSIKNRDRIIAATARAGNILLTPQNVNRAVHTAIQEVGQALGVERGFIFEITDCSHGLEHRFCIKNEWRLNENCPSFIDQDLYQDALLEEVCPAWLDILSVGGMVRVNGLRSDEPSFEQLRYFNSRSMLVAPMWVEGRLYGFFGVDYCNCTHLWGDVEISAVKMLSTSLSGLLSMREHELELRAARDLADAASSAKGEFLAMMSHEIRTPMNAIIGYTDLLSRTDLSSVQQEHTSIIQRSGRALLNLINNILDFSKIDSSSIELESVEFDLEQVICESLESILVTAKEKGLQVDYDIAEDIAETYIGDGHRLRQVLMNLVNNAVKFTQEGRVDIRVELQGQAASSNDDILHFEVRDTGCGIAPSQFDRLFHAFSQVETSTARKFGGTGLGLVISKRLIECMQGEIWVCSDVGEGSRFHFTIKLPRAHSDESVVGSALDVAAAIDDSLEPTFASLYPLRILLCEDDEDNRWIIRELLETLGYRPNVVETGEDALEQLKHRAYDLVLLDVHLPGLSGIELTQAIRNGAEVIKNNQQYIVAVTAFAMNEDREKCLDAGMNNYIRKPVEIIELKEALKHAYLEHSGVSLKKMS